MPPAAQRKKPAKRRASREAPGAHLKLVQIERISARNEIHRKTIGGTTPEGGVMVAEVITLRPQLTETARERLVRREREPCGPTQVAERVMAMAEARRAAEREPTLQHKKMLAGSLDDAAAAMVVWANRIRAEIGR